jgi:hypothetical protein
MSELSQLSEVKRKSDFGTVRAAFDPSETSNLIASEAVACIFKFTNAGIKQCGWMQ